MDYCSSCRRHLNGALVCPGCGAYAPDIAPAVIGGRLAPASATMAAVAPTAATTEADVVDLADVPTVPEGRAARRRQRDRWRKNQRRAVVATAFALVGGGLTVSAMDRQSGDQAQAATAPQNPGLGAVEEQAEDPSSEQDTRPTSVPPATHRSSPPPPPRSLPAERTSPRHAAASLPTTPAPPAPPRTTVTTAPQPARATTEPARTPVTPTTPSTPSTPSTQPSAPPATGTGPSDTSPPPATTSPTEVCLLVVCVGLG